jgi:FlaA1/EpsC-like NDP-sugar epimerase
VLGIGEESIAMAGAILDNPSLPYYVEGFLTQRYDTTNAKILGKPIYTKEKLESLTIDDLDIEGVLIIKENLSRDEMNMG